MQKIELLAPAKNIEIGKAAINCGADAVYIGAGKFGARVAASNSITDIEKLVKYAHKYGAKIFTTLNTVLYDKELEQARKLTYELYNIGVDALIIQDTSLLNMDIAPIALHASTQMNNDSLQKIQFLKSQGIERVVLPREFSLNQIQHIHNNINIELEGFVHGALCVSYSGQCYFSNALGQRSANRGECAQPCRKQYNFMDKQGQYITKNKYLLSLKDLNLSDYLNELIHAGISSLKIEGRLKDENYVKNIVGWYRNKLDVFIHNNKDYVKASSGKVELGFEPDVEKTFNRGYCNYFIKDRNKQIYSPNTPKSKGKFLGKVTKIEKNFIELNTNQIVNNGDGICFLNKKKQLVGTQVVKAISNKIFINKTNGISLGVEIYRNNDIKFTKLLESSKNSRKVEVDIYVNYNNGVEVTAIDEDNFSTSIVIDIEKEMASNKELAIKTIKKQLSKSGESIFKVNNINISFESIYFIPTKLLNEKRRLLFDKLTNERILHNKPKDVVRSTKNVDYPQNKLTYLGNVLNKKAFDFYVKSGVESIDKGFELLSTEEKENKEIMITKHCLKYQYNMCPKYNKNIKHNFEEPFYIQDQNQKFKLEFDCKNCVMKIKK